MGSLPAAHAYRLWAATYEADNPVSVLDENAVSVLTPILEGQTLLDVGCGTGRRLRALAPAKPKFAVGVDLVPHMLRENSDPTSRRRTAAANMNALPIRTKSVGIVWCRLAIGHVKDLVLAYEELARVTKPDGVVIVTDFHPDAASSGHVRTFRDEAGTLHTVEHFCHGVVEHIRAASRVRLRLDRRVDSRVDSTVKNFYDAAGKQDLYADQEGLPLVLSLRFRS